MSAQPTVLTAADQLATGGAAELFRGNEMHAEWAS
jgi:hypothetical protein